MEISISEAYRSQAVIQNHQNAANPKAGFIRDRAGSRFRSCSDAACLPLNNSSFPSDLFQPMDTVVQRSPQNGLYSRENPTILLLPGL